MNVGRDSSVGTASRYWLDGPGLESRCEARFHSPVQTGPGAHPAFYTMGTGSFPGVKQLGRGVGYPSPSSAAVKDGTTIALLPLWAFVSCSRVTFHFTFTFTITMSFIAATSRKMDGRTDGWTDEWK
jgi:hypothetical protein